MYSINDQIYLFVSIDVYYKYKCDKCRSEENLKIMSKNKFLKNVEIFTKCDIM